MTLNKLGIKIEPILFAFYLTETVYPSKSARKFIFSSRKIFALFTFRILFRTYSNIFLLPWIFGMNVRVPSQYLQELFTSRQLLFCRELSVEVELDSVPFLRAGFSQAFATVHIIRQNNINCFKIITVFFNRFLITKQLTIYLVCIYISSYK